MITLQPRMGRSTTGGFRPRGIERQVGGHLAADLAVMSPHARRTNSKSPGISRIMTQAPSRNFDTRTTTRVTPVQTAPAALITIDFFAWLPASRLQCTTIPACESVNARNAPTANSGIR